MKSSSIKKLRKLLESEVEQAESIIAARGFSQELQSMLEKLGRLLNEDLPAVAEQMRHSLGADTATAFENQTTDVIQGVMDQLRSGKQNIDNSVAAIGEGQPISDVPAMDDDLSDDLLDIDVAGSEEDLDIEPPEDIDLDDDQEEEDPALGRARKESIEHNKKKIKESDDVSHSHGDEVLDALRKIVDERHMTEVPFKDGGVEVDMFTASAVLKVYDAVNPENKEKMKKVMSTFDGFVKLSDFAFKQRTNESTKKGLDWSRQAKAYRDARKQGKNTFSVDGKTFKIMGDKEDLEEMDKMCEKFLEYSVKTEDWDELERRSQLKKDAGDQPLLKTHGDEYKEKDKHGDAYKIKGPKSKLPESVDDSEFHSYVLSFYGDGGLYDIGATEEEVKKATDIVKSDVSIDFEGDSIDRERVRDVIVDQLRG